MKILFSIIMNAFILFSIAYLLSANPEKNIPNGVILWCVNCWLLSITALKTYAAWGIILWIMNITIRPILKILSLPFYLVLFSLVWFIVNWIILWLFDSILNRFLQISGISYSINWTVNFIIAVAIFTFMNMIYSLIFSK